MRSSHLRGGSGGFTLTELMVVVFIIGITSAIALSSNQSTLSSAASYSQQIYTELTRAQTAATSTGSYYVVAFSASQVQTFVAAEANDGTLTVNLSAPQRSYPTPAFVAVWEVNNDGNAAHNPTPASPMAGVTGGVYYLAFDNTGLPYKVTAWTGSTPTFTSLSDGTIGSAAFIYIATTNTISVGHPRGKNALTVSLLGKASGSSWN